MPRDYLNDAIYGLPDRGGYDDDLMLSRARATGRAQARQDAGYLVPKDEVDDLADDQSFPGLVLPYQKAAPKPRAQPVDDVFGDPYMKGLKKQQTALKQDAAIPIAALNQFGNDLRARVTNSRRQLALWDATDGLALRWPKIEEDPDSEAHRDMAQGRRGYDDPLAMQIADVKSGNQGLGRDETGRAVAGPVNSDTVRDMEKRRRLLIERRQRIADEHNKLEQALVDFETVQKPAARDSLRRNLTNFEDQVLRPETAGRIARMNGEGDAANAVPQVDYLAPEGNSEFAQRIRDINLNRRAQGQRPIPGGSVSADNQFSERWQSVDAPHAEPAQAPLDTTAGSETPPDDFEAPAEVSKPQTQSQITPDQAAEIYGEIKAYEPQAADTIHKWLQPFIGRQLKNPDASTLENEGIVGGMFHPSAPWQLPEAGPQDSTAGKIAAGAYNPIAGAANSMIASPGGMMSLGVGGALASAAKAGSKYAASLLKLMSGGFAADMSRQAVEGASPTYAKLTDPNVSLQDKISAAVGETLAVAGAGAAGRHAMRGEAPRAGEQLSPESDAVPVEPTPAPADPNAPRPGFVEGTAPEVDAELGLGEPAAAPAATPAPAPQVPAHRVTIQRAENGILPYEQLDLIENADSARSTNRAQLASEGVELPAFPEDLPTGQYDWKDGKYEPVARETGAAPEAESNMPDWAREEMSARGLDPARPLNDIDVANASVRDAVTADPTLTDEQKANTLATGSPETPAIASSEGVATKPRRARKSSAPAVDAQRETIDISGDKPLGQNAAGEGIFERPDGTVYRMRGDRVDRPHGYPDFGGDLAPVERGPSDAAMAAEPEPSVSGIVSGSEAEKWADQRIKDQAGRASSGVDPELIAAYAVKGAAMLERGVRDFASWSAEALKNFGEAIRPHLEAVWNRAQDMLARKPGAFEGTPMGEQFKSRSERGAVRVPGGEEEAPTFKHEETLKRAGAPIEPGERDVMPRAMAKGLADAAVVQHGEAQALEHALSGTGPIEPGADTVVITNAEKKLFDTFTAAKDPAEKQRALDQLVTLSRRAAERGVDLGRPVNFLDEVNRWTPQGLVDAAIEQTTKKRDKVLGEKGVKAARDQVGVVNAANAEAIAQLVRGVGMRLAHRTLREAPGVERTLGVTRIDKTLWERYKDEAAKKWAATVEQGLPAKEGAPKPPMQEFTDVLTREVQNQISEAMPAEKRASAPRLTPAQVIGEAVNNRAKYKDAWDAARAHIEEKYKGEPDILERLDESLAGVLDRPFSKQTLDRAIQDAAKQANTRIGDVITQHYTKADAMGRTLAQRLTDEAGLRGPEAERVQKLVQERVAEMTTIAKDRELRRRQARSELTGEPRRVLRKGLADKLIEASNLGALSDEQFLQMTAKDLKLPELNPAQAAKLTEIGKRIQEAPAGFQKNAAVIDALTELKNIKGLSKTDIATAIYYFHLLAGPTTHLKNIGSTMIQSVADTALLAATNPAEAAWTVKGFLAGLSQGLKQARRTMGTGYADRGLHSKVMDTGTSASGNAPLGALEILSRGQPENVRGQLLKGYAFVGRYVPRAMQAADAVFFESAKSAFEYTAAAKLAKAANEGMPRAKLNRSIRDLLNIAPDAFEAARKQATAEGLKDFDHELRVAEIIRQRRRANLGDEAAGEAENFGRQATFNEDPRGVLGAFHEAIQSATEKVPALRLVLPFTKVVANVSNATMNYTPAGIVRGARGKYLGEEVMPQWERKMTLAKGVIGTAGLTALVAYGLKGREKDKQPWITGRGPSKPKARAQLRATGWMPYSIHIGDRWIPYQSTVASVPLAIAGNWLDAMHYDKLDQKALGQQLAAGLMGVPGTITSQSFLQSLGGALDAFHDDGAALSSQAANAMHRLGESTVGAMVPGGNATQFVDRLVDSKLRDTSGTIMGRVPGYRETLPVKTDVRGREIDVPSMRSIVGQATSNDPVAQLIAEKQAWIPEMGRPTIGQGKNKRPATDDEFKTMQRESGQEIDRALNQLLPRLRNLPAPEVKRLVESVSRDAHARARIRAELKARQ